MVIQQSKSISKKISRYSVFGLMAAAFVVAGCNQSNNTASMEDTNNVSTNSNWQDVKTNATEAWQNVKEGATQAWTSVKEGSKEAWTDVKESLHSNSDYAYAKKNDFVAGAREDLNALDQKIQQLSDKIATTTGDVKAQAQQKLADLRAQRADLNDRLDQVENSNESDWDQMKDGFRNAYDNTKTAVKNAWDWLVDKMS